MKRGISQTQKNLAKRNREQRARAAEARKNRNTKKENKMKKEKGNNDRYESLVKKVGMKFVAEGKMMVRTNHFTDAVLDAAKANENLTVKKTIAVIKKVWRLSKSGKVVRFPSALKAIGKEDLIVRNNGTSRKVSADKVSGKIDKDFVKIIRQNAPRDRQVRRMIKEGMKLSDTFLADCGLA